MKALRLLLRVEEMGDTAATASPPSPSPACGGGLGWEPAPRHRLCCHRVIQASIGFALGVALALPCEAAERAKAEVHCVPAGPPLTYQCLIRLTHARTGSPLTGARLTVGADMPSMPMAHAVKPVPATPAGEPGLYRARIVLEMTGEWALQLKLSAPFRDLIVIRQAFSE